MAGRSITANFGLVPRVTLERRGCIVTANSALEIASRITAPVPLGLVTPSQAFGPDFVLSLPGCSRTDIPARSHASSRAEQEDI